MLAGVANEFHQDIQRFGWSSWLWLTWSNKNIARAGVCADKDHSAVSSFSDLLSAPDSSCLFRATSSIICPLRIQLDCKLRRGHCNSFSCLGQVLVHCLIPNYFPLLQHGKKCNHLIWGLQKISVNKSIPFDSEPTVLSFWKTYSIKLERNHLRAEAKL